MTSDYQTDERRRIPCGIMLGAFAGIGVWAIIIAALLRLC